jgi:hypothetical protein
MRHYYLANIKPEKNMILEFLDFPSTPLSVPDQLIYAPSGPEQ